MPVYRDLAASLALGWAVTTGASLGWCDEGFVLVGQAAPQAGATADKAVDLEVIRERYPDRSVKIERHVTQDGTLNYLNHGPWTMWDPAGAVIAKGEYWQGKRHGEWKRFYLAPSDQHPVDLPERPVAVGDAFDGPEFKGFEKPFTSTATFVEDKIVGTWSVTDAGGRTLLSIELDRGLPQGKASWYFSTGNKRRELDFKQGVVDGAWQEFDEAGNAIRKDQYVEGRRQADSVTRYPTGEKSSEGVYLYAKENVRVELDWWTGGSRVAVLGTEGQPIKQGKWNYWYEDGGKRCEAEYVDDKPVARHVWWYRNGQKECEGEFVDGKSQGTWVYWHDNGQKAAQGDYYNGTKVGKWLRWSGEGKVIESKDHPYANVAAQTNPYVRGTQPVNVPQQLPPQSASTVPAGPGYPINTVPAATPLPAPPASAIPIGPQGLQPGYPPYQPSQSAKAKGVFRR